MMEKINVGDCAPYDGFICTVAEKQLISVLLKHFREVEWDIISAALSSGEGELDEY